MEIRHNRSAVRAKVQMHAGNAAFDARNCRNRGNRKAEREDKRRRRAEIDGGKRHSQDRVILALGAFKRHHSVGIVHQQHRLIYNQVIVSIDKFQQVS